MKGLWKESLGGWDRKGVKRKAQSRKHTLKDNAKAIYHKFAYSEVGDDAVYNVEKAGDITHYNEKEFVYNKPFGVYERIRFLPCSSEYAHDKKAYKKIAHKKARRAAKEWIAKENYDGEAIPNNCASPLLYS